MSDATMPPDEPRRGPVRPPRPPRPATAPTIRAPMAENPAPPAAPTTPAPVEPGRLPPTVAPEPRPTTSAGRRVPWGTVGWATAILAVGALLGAGVAVVLTNEDEANGAAAPPAATTTSAPASTTTAEAPADSEPTAETVPSSVPTTATTVPAAAGDPMAMAAALAPMQLPSDCGLPLGTAESLPNAARAYRGGVHEGIDFICREFGRDAVAALDGQVLVADASFVDPEPEERLEILDTAKSLGYTPPWTLAMLFGRFVVIDHGVRPGVGHVVTIYAHLNEIDPSIRPGKRLEAGDRIGEIGNAGTESAGTGEDRPQAIHLHWEIHIDDEFLGSGLSATETSDVYATLFGQ